MQRGLRGHDELEMLDEDENFACEELSMSLQLETCIIGAVCRITIGIDTRGGLHTHTKEE